METKDIEVFYQDWIDNNPLPTEKLPMRINATLMVAVIGGKTIIRLEP